MSKRDIIKELNLRLMCGELSNDEYIRLKNGFVNQGVQDVFFKKIDHVNPMHHKATGNDVWDITKNIINSNPTWDKTDAMFFTYAFKHLPRAGMKVSAGSTPLESKILDIEKSITYLEQWKKELTKEGETE